MTRLHFGGSFNPPHLGHLICARAVAEARGFGQVVLLPSSQPPHKPGDTSLAPAVDRLAMCRLAVADDPLFAVDDLEIRRDGPSYTIDTVRLLRQRQERVCWLIGADMAAILPQWRQSQELLEEVEFVLMARPGWAFDWGKLPEPYRKLRHHVVAAPLIEISATDIRRRIAAGLPIRYLVSPAVEQYIEQHGLYRHPSR